MVKLNKSKAAAAGVEKKGALAIKKEKVAKPAPANRVAVSKAAGKAAAVAKKAANKPAPKKQIKAEADSDEEDLNETADSEDTPKVRVPGVSVFVGNLPASTKRNHIQKLFAPHTKILRVRFRQSNGKQLFKVKKSELKNVVAFVDVPTLHEAEASAAALNQTEFRGNNIRVNLNSKAQPGSEKRTAFVGNLNYQTTDQDIQETFGCCGEIDYVRTLVGDKGCAGTAFVCFKDAASVEMALELNGGELNGRPMTVTKCRPQADKPAKVAGAPKAVKQEKSDKPQFAGAKVAGGKKGGKPKKGGLSGPKLLAKKVAPRPANVTA